MAARNFIVTGANGVIGKEIVKGIARTGAHVVLAVRRMEAGQRTVDEIVKEANLPKENFEVMQVDLSNQASIKQFADKYKKEHKTLHGLVNNAALNSSGSGQLSADGIELTWASNVMSYFLLSNLLLDTLKASAPARIVNVASNFAGELDVSDVQFNRRRYSVVSAYKQSKQANRMLSWALHDRIKGSGVTVNACHPGVVTSPVLQSLGMAQGSQSADQGAATPVFLATSPKVENVSGKYFVHSEETRCGFANKKEYDELWDVASKLVQVKA
eukprot:Phypoly_transcript_14341.p1 GENE.Phypoly_transcript_14341~~Phypoly_transcript_14341.p1  ORF type:complete len:272 (+),score=47.22 Phypoly_transcript_14341:118-933(+)